MAAIHSTAVIDPAAELHESVDIGPYCVIGPHVRVGARTRLHSHVVLDGHTTLGESCTVFPFASIGTQTQDLKYRGGITRVEIGDRTTLREYVTVSSATSDGGVTRLGSDGHIMAYAHIAHDCLVGDGVIMANAATLAGHVIIEDQVIVGGLSGVHQFVRIGRLALVGGCTKITQDVPPYVIADGNPATIHGLNSIGMKRKGVAPEAAQSLKKAHRILFREGLTTRAALERIRAEVPSGPEIVHLLGFVEASERGITK